MSKIDRYTARSGRLIKEDGTYVNVAEGYDEDGTQRVKLTGSIVKEATAENIIVAAGASKYIDIVFSSKVSAISIAARTTAVLDEPKFMWALANGTTTTINLTVNELPLEYASSNNSFQTKKIDALNNKMRIKLSNSGAGDVTVQQLTIRLYGANMDSETATFSGM